MSISTALRRRWAAVSTEVEYADIGFLLLRAAALAGNIAWPFLARLPAREIHVFYGIAWYFVGYCLFIYVLLFLFPGNKKFIYSLSLVLDLSYVYLLAVNSGGPGSSFFIGLYLLTALHSFYSGHIPGLVVASCCAVVYYLGSSRVSPVDRIDFLLRVTFLFLIALPIGLLSGRMRRDKERIESLNAELSRSIEELKRLHAKLVRAEKLSALGRLTSDVAHEIRNPLTVIGGFTKRLEKRLPESTKEKEYAGTVCREVARLERILKEILSFSRDSKEHIRYMNINEILAEAASALGEPCRERSVTLSLEPAPDLPMCLVDRDQVRQAVDNLLANAIDAMPKGGQLTLRSRTDVEHGVHHVVVEVGDTGSGIPAEILDRIFEPFFSARETGHGTGLGLSICKKIMEEHRGAIQVTSTPGKGSTFSLHFPFLPEGESFEIQCWEYTRCGMDKIEPGAARCPAYPRYGRICWAVAGTFAETKVQGVLAEKLGDCRKCAFYAMVQGGDG